MSRSLFAVDKGFRQIKEDKDHGVDGDSVDKIFDSGAPVGNAGETDTAKIGSSYSNTDDGSHWKKITNTSSAADWVELLASTDGRKQLIGVVAAPQVLDSVKVDDVLATEWEVHTRDDANPERVKVVKIFAVHDGEPAADAVNTDDTLHSRLKIGPNFTTQYVVMLSGAGANQVMELSVTGQVGGVTFTSRRTDIRA